MSAGTEQRKLAAIMFTDMVGYSALSQRDDKLALELLEEHRQLLREIFPRFNGTEIKTIGDAFLVEFHSALEAAQCAIEIQRTLAKRNHDVPADRRIEIKIGIHIGDVVHRGGDVYGDGVNIASRIEPLAGAGGICVSMDVERQIRNALEARFEKARADRVEEHFRGDGFVSHRAAVGEGGEGRRRNEECRNERERPLVPGFTFGLGRRDCSSCRRSRLVVRSSILANERHTHAKFDRARRPNSASTRNPSRCCRS